MQEAVKKFQETIEDFSSLDVESYMGQVTAAIQGSEKSSIIDWEKLIAEAKPGGTISLKLASHFKCDGDATLFVAEGEIPQSVQAAHDAAVTAGRQIRKDLLDLFSDLIKGLK